MRRKSTTAEVPRSSAAKAIRPPMSRGMPATTMSMFSYHFMIAIMRSWAVSVNSSLRCLAPKQRSTDDETQSVAFCEVQMAEKVELSIVPDSRARVRGGVVQDEVSFKEPRRVEQ